MNMKFMAVLCSMYLLSIPLSVQATVAQPVKPAAMQQNNVSPKINLNTATLATLTGSFKGIGKKRAEAIIAYRDSHHGFKSIDELAEVKGLGAHFVNAHRDALNEVYTLQ